MRLLLLFVVLGIVGYFIYKPSPEVSPALTATATPTPTPVPFAIKSNVRNLYEEWKRRELGNTRGASTLPQPSELRTRIKSWLFEQGQHTDGAMHDVIVKALGELGVQPSDRKHVASGIMSMQ